MRVIRLGVCRMMMVIMPMVMVMMPVPMMMIVIMMMVVIRLETAHTCAESIAELAIRNIGTRRRGTLPFDVMVMAFLDSTNLCLKTDHLSAVFTQNTGLRRNLTKGGVIARLDRSKAFGGLDVLVLTAFERKDLLAERTDTAVRDHSLAVLLFDPFGKGLKNLWVIVKITGFDKMNIGMLSRNLIGEAIDPVDQNAGEKEIGEHHNALVAKFGDVLQCGLDQREGDTGIPDLTPAKAHTLPENTGDL